MQAVPSYGRNRPSRELRQDLGALSVGEDSNHLDSPVDRGTVPIMPPTLSA